MSSFSLTPTPRPAGPLAQVTIAPELLSATAVTRRPPCPSWETGGACGRGKAVQATVEHREPCDSRGSCTVLGAPGGEIPPGDSTTVRARFHGLNGSIVPIADLPVLTPERGLPTNGQGFLAGR